MPSACWLIGGGPSLERLPWQDIAASPLPKMCVNLAGTRLIRPTFWTSYDPTARFHRSLYLDPGVFKFVHQRRATELVPETGYQVRECPATFFFGRDQQRGFSNFLSPTHTSIVDWGDSMVQAIDILYQLGFRTLYLAGCEMRVRPAKSQIEFAQRSGVKYDPQGTLKDFVAACEQSGITTERLDEVGRTKQYHFDEHKPIRAAAETDFHYYRIANCLRQSQRAMTTVGMRLISVTPQSRLNGWFPYRPAHRVDQSIVDGELLVEAEGPACQPPATQQCESA
jgi:hypothetical protein